MRKTLKIYIIQFLIISTIITISSSTTFLLGFYLGERKATKNIALVINSQKVPCEVVEYHNPIKRITVVRAGTVMIGEKIVY